MARQPLPVPQAVKRVAWLLLAGGLAAMAPAATVSELLRDAGAAEARLDSARALELYRQADAAQPDDVRILQKVARQYSDLVLDQATDAERRRCAEAALDYARRAVALDPRDPVSVLSVAIAYGKIASCSDPRDKVRYSRRVKEEAERALALDPDYAWAHHILGRWHREVAALGPAARGFVWLLYGGLPGASPAEAVTRLQRAVELEPGELNHHLELGFALAAVGRKSEARQAWTQGLGMPSVGKHDEAAKREAREALAATE